MKIKLDDNLKGVKFNGVECNGVKFNGSVVWERPDIYEVLESIESDGQQYIDTDIQITEDISVSIDCTPTNGVTQYLFGVGNSFDSFVQVLRVVSGTTFSTVEIRTGVQTDISASAVGLEVGKPFKLKQMFGGKAEINGTEYVVNSDFARYEEVNPPDSTSSRLRIFGTSTTNGFLSWAKTRAVIVERGGVVVANFVPRRNKVTGKSGLLETISNVFYPSSTAVDFVPHYYDPRGLLAAYYEDGVVKSANLFSNSTLEIGGLDGSSGEEYPVSTRLRSSEFINIGGGSRMTISNKKMRVILFFYSESEMQTDNTFLKDGWGSGNDITYEIPENSFYLKYLLRRIDNEAITPDDRKNAQLMLSTDGDTTWRPSLSDLQVNSYGWQYQLTDGAKPNSRNWGNTLTLPTEALPKLWIKKVEHAISGTPLDAIRGISYLGNTNFIDTGIVPTDTMEIRGTFSILQEHALTYSHFLGLEKRQLHIEREGSPAGRPQISIYLNGGKTTITQDKANVIFEVSINFATGVWRIGDSTGNFDAAKLIASNTKSLLLFSAWAGDGYSDRCADSINCHDLQIIDAGKTILDYDGWQTIDNQVGMLDTITSTFHGNDATGDGGGFIAVTAQTQALMELGVKPDSTTEQQNEQLIQMGVNPYNL